MLDAVSAFCSYFSWFGSIIANFSTGYFLNSCDKSGYTQMHVFKFYPLHLRYMHVDVDFYFHV